MTDRQTTIVAGVILLGSLAGVASMAGQLRDQRDKLRLVVKSEGIAGMPPHVAVVTAALGTFRGLAVDFLWARAEHLEREGEYYEAQSLAEWITTLQPRFQKVWWFQSFNLAWNITAATQVPAERWGWINRGIELLRAKGIPLNPGSADLYFDLAWIFEDKIASTRDKQHWYYKARFAAEMQEFLGSLTQGRSTNAAIERFRTIAESPATLEELVAEIPEVVTAIELFRSHGVAPDESVLRMIGRATMQFSALDQKILGSFGTISGEERPFLEALSESPEIAQIVFNRIVPHLQRRVLEDRYKMNPDRMVEVMQRYGPLDWRNADAHAIYWSEQGLSASQDSTTRDDANELMLLRARLMVLINLLRAGRIEYDPATSSVDLLPDPRFAPKFEEALEDAVRLINSEDGVTAAGFGRAEEADLFATWETFLNLATILTFLYGDEAEAKRYYLQYIRFAERQGFASEPVFQGTLENFVAIRFADMVQVKLGDLRTTIDAMIRRGLSQGLGRGDLKTFARFLKLARTVYKKRYGAADQAKDFVLEQYRLPPFGEMLEATFENVIKDPSISLLERARMWAWSPEDLRRRCYKAIIGVVEPHATAAGLDPARVFPAPPNTDNPPDFPIDEEEKASVNIIESK